MLDDEVVVNVSAELLRAMQKACSELCVSMQELMVRCIMGAADVRRFIDSLDEDDLRWCHEHRLEAMRLRRAELALERSAAV